MSCDHNLATFCTALAAAGGPLARAFGDDPALAAAALVEIHGLARARAEQEADPTDRLDRVRRRAADAQAREQATALLVRMREQMAGVPNWRLPVHGEAKDPGALPLPRDRDALYGLQALSETINAAEAGESLPILAQQVRYARLPRDGETSGGRMRGLIDNMPALLDAANGDAQAIEGVQTTVGAARRFFERRPEYPLDLHTWKAAHMPSGQAGVRELTPAAAAICQAAGAPRCGNCGRWVSPVETAHACPPKRSEPFDVEAFMTGLMTELKAGEDALEREIAENPPTDAQRSALRAALDADLTLEDDLIDFQYTDHDAALDTRGTALADRLPADVPPRVREALRRYQDDARRYTLDDDLTRGSRKRLIEAVREIAAPRAPDPTYPAGAMVSVAVELPRETLRRSRVPKGTTGRVVRWERGFAIIAFDLPLEDPDGTWVRGDEDDSERRTIRLGFRPYELERLSGADALQAAASYQHREDRIRALADLARVSEPGLDQDTAYQAAIDTALQISEAHHRATMLAELLPAMANHPAAAATASHLLRDLPHLDGWWLEYTVETAAPHLPVEYLHAALDVARRKPADARAVKLRSLIATRLPQVERAVLLAEARRIAEGLPETGERGATPRADALRAVQRATAPDRSA